MVGLDPAIGVMPGTNPGERAGGRFGLGAARRDQRHITIGNFDRSNLIPFGQRDRAIDRDRLALPGFVARFRQQRQKPRLKGLFFEIGRANHCDAGDLRYPGRVIVDADPPSDRDVAKANDHRGADIEIEFRDPLPTAEMEIRKREVVGGGLVGRRAGRENKQHRESEK